MVPNELLLKILGNLIEDRQSLLQSRLASRSLEEAATTVLWDAQLVGVTVEAFETGNVLRSSDGAELKVGDASKEEIWPDFVAIKKLQVKEHLSEGRLADVLEILDWPRSNLLTNVRLLFEGFQLSANMLSILASLRTKPLEMLEFDWSPHDQEFREGEGPASDVKACLDHLAALQGPLNKGMCISGPFSISEMIESLALRHSCYTACFHLQNSTGLRGDPQVLSRLIEHLRNNPSNSKLCFRIHGVVDWFRHRNWLLQSYRPFPPANSTSERYRWDIQIGEKRWDLWVFCHASVRCWDFTLNVVCRCLTPQIPDYAFYNISAISRY